MTNIWYQKRLALRMETFDQLTSSSFELHPCLRCRDKTLIIARQCLMVLEANQEVCQGFTWRRKLLTLIDLQRYISTREAGPFFHPNNGGAVELAL